MGIKVTVGGLAHCGFESIVFRAVIPPVACIQVVLHPGAYEPRGSEMAEHWKTNSE